LQPEDFPSKMAQLSRSTRSIAGMETSGHISKVTLRL